MASKQRQLSGANVRSGRGDPGAPEESTTRFAAADISIGDPPRTVVGRGVNTIGDIEIHFSFGSGGDDKTAQRSGATWQVTGSLASEAIGGSAVPNHGRHSIRSKLNLEE